MRIAALSLTLFSTLVLGACDPAPTAPANPTWAKDILPIIRGNCAHCHGWGPEMCRDATEDNPKVVTACFPASALKLDYLTSAAFKPQEAPSATDLLWRVRDKSKQRMPPPPAQPLEDWQIETIKNWYATGAVKGEHDPNFPPVARISKRQVGQEVEIRVDVSDGNGDFVTGKIVYEVNGEQQTKSIDYVGRTVIRVPSVEAANTVRVEELSDGF